MMYADNFCTYTEDADGYTFTGPCMNSGKEYSVKVPKEGLYKYRCGALIQDAFPDLSAGDREFLITGFSPEGWDHLYPPAKESCAYCGYNCPNEPDDSENLCDGFAGDIDGLYESQICDCKEAEESHFHCKYCDCVLNWSDDTSDEVCASCGN